MTHSRKKWNLEITLISEVQGLINLPWPKNYSLPLNSEVNSWLCLISDLFYSELRTRPTHKLKLPTWFTTSHSGSYQFLALARWTLFLFFNFFLLTVGQIDISAQRITNLTKMEPDNSCWYVLTIILDSSDNNVNILKSSLISGLRLDLLISFLMMYQHLSFMGNFSYMSLY